ncbi:MULTISPECIES: GNAT family N-acetyltransferase [Xanthomonas]|uniref:N-acetyltransferase domain-containing protein n=2 Tax=Xanthomonas TaxID=338 RepID=A0A7Z7NIF4_XANCH|nr:MULTISPECIES: GNAT family N-acetyltransferase [Xanthomonas]ATS38550.1 GNAT family N-acetyltransferase [Xanthomonas citri pv. phaseoli var. fuscans]ATS42648.1 GNAT family N-acetyltransferase [Xanthomonas citri pv. phaseoli var. fuscans]ATS46551.1 GNAT family N-acetyltransferase [Xanthomonas citri pv. phaseoli var. fuscans]ATS83190.1 GNAT family N-acetyltransferase [Xanthomonas citri pv. phaseoli var. fuscans]QWN20208.1 GNAT family N-acetyltransferase [Xanthomonas citri]
MTAYARPQIVTLDPAADAAALRALRLACATDTAGATGGVQWDALDPLSLHLAVRDEGQLIASVRLTADRRLDRLGVLPNWRRRGVADQLLAAAVDAARRHGWPSLRACPSPAAEAVFARLGFLPDAGTLSSPERIGQAHDAPGTVVYRRLDGPMAVDSFTAALAATTGLLCAARRQVLIYTRALDPPLFDNAAVLDALRRFATARHDKRVHVLVQDTASAAASSSAMLRLAQRLPSVFRFRAVSDSVDASFASVYVVGDEAYYFRPTGHRFDDGETWLSGAARSRQLEREFAQIWERSALWNEPRALGI